MLSLTRLYRFSASHRLHVPAFSPAENARLFGKCNNPYGHGHDYTLAVTVSGDPDPVTGLLLPLSLLDRLVDRQVLRSFAFRYINLELPQFQTRTATTENIALVIVDLLQQGWQDYLARTPAKLTRVHIQETERNSFEVLIGAPASTPDQFTIESAVHG